VHKAKHLRPDGAVSPLCARTPRAIDLKRATWTLHNDAVTCSRCLAVLHRPRPPSTLNAADRTELDRAARFSRLVQEAIAAGVPQDEAVRAIYPDVYPEADVHEALRS
jgi:hypothetical protein